MIVSSDCCSGVYAQAMASQLSIGLIQSEDGGGRTTVMTCGLEVVLHAVVVWDRMLEGWQPVGCEAESLARRQGLISQSRGSTETLQCSVHTPNMANKNQR
jgi:hypothetical protein